MQYLLGWTIMAKMKSVVLLLLCIAALVPFLNAQIVYIFQQEIYEYDETVGTATIMIQRTSTTALDLTTSSFTTVSTDCPAKVTATTSSTDYSVAPTTLNFGLNVNLVPVTVTIENDNEEEFREFFCLTITTNPGTLHTIKVYIKGNDNCVNVNTPSGTTSINTDMPNDMTTRYVGPWFTGDLGIPPTINIDITPESTVLTEAKDIYIFLTQNADKTTTASIGDFYGIYLDDTAATTHETGGTAAAGDSVIIRNAFDTLVGNGILNDASATNPAVVVNANANSFTLKYTQAMNDPIVLMDTDNSRSYQLTDASTPVDVNHIFVASGDMDFAAWKVCGLRPRRLPVVGAYASGDVGAYSPSNAIDNGRGPLISMSGCFVSNTQTDPWLQVDLGREFNVEMILIWPIERLTGVVNTPQTDLNDAEVWVGSCPSTSIADITSNHVCDNNIGTFGTARSVIEVKCNPGNIYGRYVYILKDTTSNDQISLCEVEVYGDDIPIGNEAVVEFSSATYATINDESAVGVAITATRTGTNPTCTSVDFYTDASSTNDYTATPSNNPTPLKWVKSDTSGATKSTTVPITNDSECEAPEVFNVYLTNVVGGTLGTKISSAVTINDDDSVTYALSSTAYPVVEGLSASIGVIRSGTGVNQNSEAGLTFSAGTAQSSDYASADAPVSFTSGGASPQSYEVSTVDDQAYEGDETFTVSLGILKPITCSLPVSPTSATVTITDNDSIFRFDSTIDSIIIPEGTSSTTVTLLRRGVVQTKTVNVNVATISGATTPSDFSVSDSSVIFTGNDASQPITINVVDDSTVENDETFSLTLEDPLYSDGHRNLENPYRLTVTIKDNDATYSWKQATYSTSEGSGTLQVSMIRSGDISTSKTIQITSTSGTATAGSDFTPLTQIVFDANSAEAFGNVPINSNGLVENTETFTLTIVSNQQDVAIGDSAITTISIIDDDSDVSWQQATYSFSESSLSNIVKVTKVGTGSTTITVTSQQESATQGVDYQPISTSITFSGATQDITVNINKDTVDEPNESFTLTLSGTGITPQTTRITIVDNDLPPPTTTAAPSDDGIGVGGIIGIAVAALIAVIAAIIGIVICCMFLNGSTGGASAAAAGAVGPAGGAGAAAGPYQGYPLSNYPLSGVNSFGNGNGLYLTNGVNQGFGGGGLYPSGF